MADKENKVNFGVKNVTLFPVNDTGTAITYEEAVKWPGAVSIELDPNGDMIELYADDMLYYLAQNNQGYNGKLEMVSIQSKIAQLILGEEVDKAGFQTETTRAKPGAVGMAFEFDGDVKATRHLLFNVQFSRPNVAGDTKTDKVDPKTSELEFKATPNPYTDQVKTKSTPAMAAELYEAWYTTPQIPTTDTESVVPKA